MSAHWLKDRRALKAVFIWDVDGLYPLSLPFNSFCPGKFPAIFFIIAKPWLAFKSLTSSTLRALSTRRDEPLGRLATQASRSLILVGVMSDPSNARAIDRGQQPCEKWDRPISRVRVDATTNRKAHSSYGATVL
ncbi:MAG: hypothetical protein ACE5OY_07990 [Candidatus Bathyarchaeia archaeon]